MSHHLSELGHAMKNTLALVLAGGRGTRLDPLTATQSKPALPFGGQFRLVDFPLSNCINSGIRRIGVATQYRSHALIHHVQRTWGFMRPEFGEFVELWPAQQQTPKECWYCGTADAVYQNIALIEEHGPRYVLILAGDHAYKQNYARLIAQHVDTGADVTVSCVEVPRALATGFGVVGVDRENGIVSFVEKPNDPQTIPGSPSRSFASMGIYVFDADFLIERLRDDADNGHSSHDFGKDILPSLVGNCRMVAHRFADSNVASGPVGEPYWRDVGTLDAYWEANLDLTRVTPELDLYDRGWPIWTHQHRRPAAKFVFEQPDRRGAAVNSLVSLGCIVSGGLVRQSLLFTDVRVNSFSLVEDSVLLPGASVGRYSRLHRTVVSEGCHIPEGLVVGEDPEEDARHFHRTAGGVTVVTRAMLARLERTRALPPRRARPRLSPTVATKTPAAPVGGGGSLGPPARTA